ncbi:chromatin structure-remodeling complex subunit RSC7 [Coemansia sp. IMI 209128]|nr:chromatin structure-remodeling complex subunit RSC7 [Coemansia sp. IMI 209128]
MEPQPFEHPEHGAMDVYLEPAASQPRYVLMPYSDTDQIKAQWPKKKKKPSTHRGSSRSAQSKFMALILEAKAKQLNRENGQDEPSTTTTMSDSDGETEAETEQNSADDNDEVPPDDDDGDSDEDTKDLDGEEKIDRNGYLLGGRSYICPVFRSPCRRNPDMLYIPAMECCRFTGFNTPKNMFAAHKNLRQFRLTARERRILRDNLVLNNMLVDRPHVAMVRARAAFKLFGALLVKDGRHIVDDYCEANWQLRNVGGEPCVSGQVVANIDYYREFRANYALGQQPKRPVTAGSQRAKATRLKMPRELSKYLLREFPVVGSCVELMEVVAERMEERRAFTRSLRAGIMPTLPGSAKAESKPTISTGVELIVIDDDSSEEESSEDEESNEDEESSEGEYSSEVEELGKDGLKVVVIDDSSD